ncbi:MAG: molybdenum cofactor guanylyltransferase [Candidatus Nezhaarchaeales archaeon]
MSRAAAIILAGGMGRRFQLPQQPWRDKALEVVNGKPMLRRVVEAALSFTDEVIVTVNSLSRKLIYEKLLEGLSGVKVAVDGGGMASGPLIGLRTGLKWLTAEKGVSIPCDSPFISPSILSYLAQAVDGVDVAMPVWGNGRLEPLFLALRRAIVGVGVDILVKLGRRRPDDLIRIGLRTRLIPVGELKTLDPELKTFVNVNRPEDLLVKRIASINDTPRASLQTLEAHQIPLERLKELSVALPLTGFKDLKSIEEVFVGSPFIIGALYEQVGFAELNRNPQEALGALRYASLQYLIEADFYEAKGLLSLAGHALTDAYRCLKPLNGVKAEAVLSRALKTYSKVGLRRKGGKAVDEA